TKGVNYAESIGGIFSMRLDASKNHFGNPFSSTIKDKTLIVTKSTRESVEKYINWVINSQDNRAEWIREQLKSGVLKGKPIVYYKELREPSHATALDYLINRYDWNNAKLASDFETPTRELNLSNVSLNEKTGILTIEGEEFPYSSGYTDFIAAGYTINQTDQLIERICKL
ncbi:hypothetical protein LCGC14_2580380, partial [marine sediment metagenome]